MRAVNESSPVTTVADGMSPTELCPCCCTHQCWKSLALLGCAHRANLFVSLTAATLFMNPSSSFFRQTPQDSSGELVTIHSVTHLTGISKRNVLCESDNDSKNKTKTPNVFKLFCSHHTETQSQGNSKKVFAQISHFY